MPAVPARLAVLTLLATLAAAASAHAADPIMPLSEVRSGMRCTGLSVIRGVEISSFDVEVLDVIRAQPQTDASRILVLASGPAVDATGIGQGFSGSPVYCPGADGVARNIGAISEGIGEYGNKTVLATPIELMLGERADPPPAARRAPALLRAARSLASPLTIGGVSPPLDRALAAAGRRAGRVVLQAPGGSLTGAFPPQQLRPGAAVGVGYSSGDIAVGAVGTVSYTDGVKTWIFGHSFSGAGTGARSLLLQDAYIYRVVNNPVDLVELTTYKLGVLGHDLGTFVNDAFNAGVGTVGTPPPLTAVAVAAADLDSDRRRSLNVRVANESGIGLPEGDSNLGFVSQIAVLEAALAVLRGLPARQSGSMCLRIELSGRDRPLRFCNTYVSRGGARAAQEDDGIGGVAALIAGDVGTAMAMIDEYNFGAPRVARVQVNMKLGRGLRQAFIMGAQAPRVVRAGQRIRVRLKLRHVGGRRGTASFSLRVPRDLRPGRRVLRVTGTDADPPGGSVVTDIFSLLLGDGDGAEGGPAGGDPGPRTLAALGRKVRGLGRYDGVRATFLGGRQGRRAYREATLRISGRARVRLRVTR